MWRAQPAQLCARAKRCRGVWEHAPPGKFLNLGHMRVLLRPSEITITTQNLWQLDCNCSQNVSSILTSTDLRWRQVRHWCYKSKAQGNKYLHFSLLTILHDVPPRGPFPNWHWTIRTGNSSSTRWPQTRGNRKHQESSRLPEGVLWQATCSSCIFLLQRGSIALSPFPLMLEYLHSTWANFNFSIRTGTWDRGTGGKHSAETAKRRVNSLTGGLAPTLLAATLGRVYMSSWKIQGQDS